MDSQKLTTFAEAFKAKYLEDAVDEHIVVSGKKVEMVGFQKTQNQFSSSAALLRSVSLKQLCVAFAGKNDTDGGGGTEIMNLCPNVIDLDLSFSSFTDWAVVVSIAVQLKYLSILDLSCNSFRAHPIVSSIPIHAFAKLRRLVLNKIWIVAEFDNDDANTTTTADAVITTTTDATTSIDASNHIWHSVVLLAERLPLLEELHLESNGIRSLVLPPSSSSSDKDFSVLFPNLKLMNLDENNLQNWALDLQPLEFLPKLETLVLNSNKFSCIPCLEIPSSSSSFSSSSSCSQKFPMLTSLSICDNPIQEIGSIQALNTFSKLTSVRVSPLLQSGANSNAVQSRSKMIPHIPKITMLNASRVSPKERADAEKQYLKDCVPVLNSVYSVLIHANDCSDVPQSFLLANPRYAELCHLYFNPTASSSTGTSATSGSGSSNLQLFNIIFRSQCAGSMQKGDKAKQLPPNTTVAKLKGICQTLFGLAADKQNLVAHITSDEGGMSIPFRCELCDDLRDLQYYCISDASIVEMHEKDFHAEYLAEQSKRSENEKRMQSQLAYVTEKADLSRI